MKISINQSNLRLMFYFFILFSISLSLTNAYSENNIFKSNYVFTNFVLPDSTISDTTDFAIGDTVAIYTSGIDTTIVTYEESLNDTLEQNGWVITYPDTRMILTLSNHDAPVNQGVFGINLTDFFEPNHANETDNANYTTAPNPWQALIDLAPKTVRIFSGAGSKFMHPLGHEIDPGGADDDVYGGYGYYWKEIVAYYDATELDNNAPLYTDIATNMLDGFCDECGHEITGWMGASFVNDFEDFYNKAAVQPTFDPDDFIGDLISRPLYINQFIDLINQVETENTYTVDVIYCVNILSETSLDVLRVIDYLRLYGINIVGVELGNEVYFDFQTIAMGFENFAHYWDYINGINYAGLIDVLPADVYADHDYITAIKGNEQYNDILIGLPAQNTPNCGEDYDFPLTPPGIAVGQTIPVNTEGDGADPCDCFYPEWNVEMVNYYDEMILPYETTEQIYKFDAVIFHTYYGPTNNTATCSENSNWRDILLVPLFPGFDPDDLTEELVPTIFTGAYDYVDGAGAPVAADVRLDDAFYGISGIHFPDHDSPLLSGNYKEFTRDRLDISFGEHAYQMKFRSTDTGPENKKAWFTEYNIDDKIDMPPGEFEESNEEILTPYIAAATNSFSHAVLMQHWFLWFLKASYDPDYRDNFLTVATTQNFLSGGSTFGLMTKSDKTDLVLIDEIMPPIIGYDGGLPIYGDPCDEPNINPYYIRKATYFAAELCRAINDNNLSYLKSTTNMSTLNNNLAPTIFIDKVNKVIYIYYTNLSATSQFFAIDPGTLAADYPGYEIDLLAATSGLILNSDQLYSTAGKSPLFLINDGYSNCTESITQENRFEIDGLETIIPTASCPGSFNAAVPGGICVSLPATSMGYFVIPYDVNLLREGQVNDVFRIFPNPASTAFIVQQKELNTVSEQTLQIQIYSIYGNLIDVQNIVQNETVNIADLPVGVYNVVIIDQNNHLESETLVKMK